MGAGRIVLDTRLDLVEARALYVRHGYAEIPALSDRLHAEIWYREGTRLPVRSRRRGRLGSLRSRPIADRGVLTDRRRTPGRRGSHGPEGRSPGDPSRGASSRSPRTFVPELAAKDSTWHVHFRVTPATWGSSYRRAASPVPSARALRGSRSRN